MPSVMPSLRKLWKFRSYLWIWDTFGVFWNSIYDLEEKAKWNATAGEVENVPLMSSISWSHFRSDLYRTSEARIISKPQISHFQPLPYFSGKTIKFKIHFYLLLQGRKVSLTKSFQVWSLQKGNNPTFVCKQRLYWPSKSLTAKTKLHVTFNMRQWLFQAWITRPETPLNQAKWGH